MPRLVRCALHFLSGGRPTSDFIEQSLHKERVSEGEQVETKTSVSVEVFCRRSKGCAEAVNNMQSFGFIF